MKNKVQLRSYDKEVANRVFGKVKNTGIQNFQPLKHKDGTKYSDIDYMYLLGKRCNEMEENGEPILYDKSCVAVAKEIVKGRDELGKSDKELKRYLLDCLDLSALG